jgi:lysophospholipase L1-like esterase
VLVALVEISLRLFGYGESIPVFVEDKVNPNFSTINPLLADRYFDINPGTPPLEFISTEKPKDEFRIFVLGASTVVGFPYGHSITFPKMLEDLLQKRYPDVNIRIVNAGLTATNTFSILDMADEIIEQSPDAIILYTGHNEYYGAFGVSSAVSYFNSNSLKRFYLSIQHFRIVQLLKQLLLRSGKGSEEGTLMAKMVGNEEIAFGSTEYYEGVTQFERNLEDITDKYSSSGIPIFIGTLVSNRKDLPPFNSSGIKEEALIKLESKGDELAGRGEYIEALDSYLEIWKSDSASAILSYKILSCYKQIEDSIGIKKFSVWSSDLDMIRFRAPSIFNSIIKSIALEEDLNLVDLEKSFEAYSNDAIGEKLILEHVHPNITGYKLMASEYFNSISSSGLLDNLSSIVDSGSNLDTYCISSVDSIYGALLIERLKLNWPFTSNPDVFHEIDYKPKSLLESLSFARYNQKIVWAEVHNRAYGYYMQNQMYNEAFCEAQNLRAEYPTLEMPYILMVKSRIPTGEFKEIRNVLERAVEQINSMQIKILLIQILILDNDLSAAVNVALGFYKSENSVENRALYELLARLKNILDDTGQEGLIQNSPVFNEASKILKDLGVPQAINIYSKI